MHTYVFAGASHRALGMYAKPMLKDFPEDCKILGVYDINYGRSKTFAAECGDVFPAFEDYDSFLKGMGTKKKIIFSLLDKGFYEMVLKIYDR